MIQEFVDKYMASQGEIKAKFQAEHPANYQSIVAAVIEAVGDPLDSTRIHVIDDGDYQGTLLFVIAETGYQPSKYYYVFVDYGSCSGCDTLEDIRGYSDDPPTEQEVKDYMTLALHIVQGLKALGD